MDKQEAREKLEVDPGCNIVSGAEFQGLLLSRRKMLRLDQPDARLRGLVDCSTGEKFYVAVEELESD